MAESQTQQWLEQSRQAWDERAEMFDAMSTANAQGEDRKRELDFVCDALGIGAGARVLDAGCGAGQFAIAFAERGCLVDGVDLSPELIGRARRHTDEAGVEVRFTVGDLATLDAPDGAYDAIVSRMALQFSPHLFAVLGEFERVSRPGATCWLSVPGALSPVYRHSWRRFLASEPEPMNYVTPWELVRLLEERGWSIGEQWGSFDSLGDGAENAASGFEIHSSPVPVQQAAATVWNVIAGVPQRGIVAK
jgi:ubiquinone/menaquinone biosynthesis C-methylase UbiE